MLGFCGNGSAPTMAGSGQVGTCEGEIEEEKEMKRNRERKEVTECDDEQSVCVCVCVSALYVRLCNEAV